MIGYPGFKPEEQEPTPKPTPEGPSLWDKLAEHLMGSDEPRQTPAEVASPRPQPKINPAGSPYIDPEKARQFQKAFQ